MSVPATVAVEGLNLLGVNTLRPTHSDYAIVSTQTARPVLTPDTVLGFEYRGEERISTAPVQRGGFSSYSKVDVPFDLRILTVCGGRNFLQTAVARVQSYLANLLGSGYGQPMTREDYLATCENLKSSIELFDVVTPDATYTGVNLVHFDYRKENRNGSVILIVDLWFQEVRETVEATYTTSPIDSASPSAASPVSVGTLTPLVPSQVQTATLRLAGFL